MTEIGIQLQNGHSGISQLRRSSFGKTACHCCPYGYHIDLDFVRFCESLAKDGAEQSPTKRQRKERRRQRQSMEVLLGLTNPVIWNIEHLLPTIVQEPSPTSGETPPLLPVRTSSLSYGNEGLKKAVLDFEATLERTAKKRPTDSSRDSSISHLMSRSYPEAESFSTLKKEESSSHVLGSSLLDFDLMCGSGTSLSAAKPLQNIREQMAISLQRMRELEEKVKIIPSLHDEIDSLKDEKSNLYSKLQEVKRALKEKEDFDRSILPQPKFNSSEKKINVRDIGISCTVLTRDVGITSISRKLKSVGTETIAETKPLTNGFLNCEKTKPLSKSIKTQIRPEVETKSTTTDFHESDKKSKRLSLKDLDVVAEIPRTSEKSNKGVQTIAKETATVLQVIEKRECGVQVEEAAKSYREAGVTAKPKLTDVSVDARPKTKDVSVSEDKTTGLLCDRCKNLKTKSVGVGLGNVKLSEAEILKNSLPERSKSFHFATSVKPKLTRNVGTGTLTPVKKLTASKNVDTQELSISRSKHIGVNTNKSKLVDMGVGADLLKPDVCEKCKSGAKTPVKNLLSTSKESGDHQPSKIPRPKSLSTTPVMERKKFMRQDTYTKISPAVQKSPTKEQAESEKRSKSRVKTLTEKLDSQPEEKVEVKLRKKNKTLSDRPVSGAEQRLSKDFKDCRISEGSERFSSQFEDFCYDYDEHYDEPDSKRNSQMFPDNALFQPIQDEPREKIKPSKEMKAAMKVVNDSLNKYPNGLPRHLKNASNIIQQEWFKISSTASANPLDVEDYLDSFEEVSSTLLEYIVNMVDNNGNTAMHYAVSHGNFDVVSILLDSKVCNINKMNAAGYTCIMLVSLAQVRSETHRQVVKRLFQLADVNIRAKQHGQTALMLAVSHGRLDMVKLLLEAGADPNIQDTDGSTALMCAAEHGHIDIVKHILAHPDCDPSIVDCDGSTALAIAMEAGNRDIGVLLYAREHFSSNSRGSSPYTSTKRRSKAAVSPHSKTPTSPNPSKRSDHSV